MIFDLSLEPRTQRFLRTVNTMSPPSPRPMRVDAVTITIIVVYIVVTT